MKRQRIAGNSRKTQGGTARPPQETTQLLLVQVVAAVFGYTLDLGDLGNKLLAVVNAVFAVLSILGIVTDPTTAGIGDSPQAMTYEEPKQNPYN